MEVSHFSRSVLFFLLLNFDLLVNEIIASKPHGKLGECNRCKVFTDSFNYWFKKTSRGKHEGGDAAWEETKLRSYSRSEMRLVEIQEGLCSELKKNQDYCYTVFEEAEQPLETWWLKNDPLATDLFTWLCIENMKYCCPNNHYGISCEPCRMDKENKVCGGRGTCDGEGTRKGSGLCKCNKGFTGKDCDECAKNYYHSGSFNCEPCHLSCEGCTGPSESMCKSCTAGWTNDTSMCVDVNECATPNTCKPNQFCVNSPGSFKCKACHESCNSCVGDGPLKCTSCIKGSTLWSNLCIDNKLKDEYASYALQRVYLYLGFIIISLIISRTSKILSAMAMIGISIYIYYSEKTMKINTYDIMLNHYFL